MDKQKLPIVYSCSGCSSAAQMANYLAIKMDRNKIAEMSCIAGVGGDVPSLVRTAKSAKEIVVLDGCSLKCAQHILAKQGLTPDHHFVLSDFGVSKRIHQDFDQKEADVVFNEIVAMLEGAPISLKDLQENQVRIREPFAEFLKATTPESNFSLSLLDVVRFAGHACPSMIGAFLMARKAAQELFEDQVVVRGDVQVSTAGAADSGATGPMGNVFSMIFGAWGESGFGGLRGQFRRRDLLKFSNEGVPAGAFRFKRLETGKQIDIYYAPAEALIDDQPIEASFPMDWRIKIKKILKKEDACLRVVQVGAE